MRTSKEENYQNYFLKTKNHRERQEENDREKSKRKKQERKNHGRSERL